MKTQWKTAFIIPALLIGMACTNTREVSYKDNVKKALEQAELKDVTVSEDRDRNTITLAGALHSDEAKRQAGEIAQAAAGQRVVANEISVEPVGVESQAKEISSNLDDGIENNYNAELISSGLDKQHIDYDARNGVLTLTGSVHTPAQRQEAEKRAAAVPNVQQVLNQLDVKR